MITTTTIIIMTITTTITTDQNIALLRLMAWLSPVFPVGSFSYSNGLERAVHDDLVTDVESLHAWLQSLVTYGSGWNDAVLFAESWRQAVSGGDLRRSQSLPRRLPVHTSGIWKLCCRALHLWSLPEAGVMWFSSTCRPNVLTLLQLGPSLVCIAFH